MRESKQPTKPWITKGLREATKLKMSFFTLAAKKDSNFIEIKGAATSRINKRNYYHTHFELNINNIKKAWEGINILINPKKGIFCFQPSLPGEIEVEMKSLPLK